MWGAWVSKFFGFSVVVYVLLTCGPQAHAYSARLTWMPVAGSLGYKLYTRPAGSAYGLGMDVGGLALDSDGLVRVVISGLQDTVTNYFAVTSYGLDSLETAFSNERAITYADVAAIVDSDADGLVDAEEDRNLNAIVDPGETDRNVWDTDGDGFSDGAEFAAGSNPLDPGSLPPPLGVPTPTRTPSPTRTATPVKTATPTPAPVSACDSATAVPASGGTFTGTTSGTSTLAGSCTVSNNAPERVFQWIPAVSGTATIGTCSGRVTSFDTVVYVRSGSCQSGAQVACNDDTSGCVTAEPNDHHGSRLTPTVTAGQTYFIVVDGYNGARGNFSLTVTPPPGGAPTPASIAQASIERTREAPSAAPRVNPARIARPLRLGDPLRCYRAKSTECTRSFLPQIGVRLVDQFTHVRAILERSHRLCVPADLNRQGVIAAGSYRERYRLKSRRPLSAQLASKAIRIQDQLGEIVVELVTIEELMVPAVEDLSILPPSSDPTPRPIDRSTCYKVRISSDAPRRATIADVSLEDQFTDFPRRFTVTRPTRLCASVGHERQGGARAEMQLCYKLRPAAGHCVSDAPLDAGGECTGEEDCGGTGGATSFCLRSNRLSEAVEIGVANEFGEETLELGAGDELCLPSLIVPADDRGAIRTFEGDGPPTEAAEPVGEE